jgi:hypothetical protein
MHVEHECYLVKINSKYPTENVHPFYFRPTLNFRTLLPSNGIEMENKKNLITNINIRSVGENKGFGLIYSILSANAPIINEEKIVDQLIESSNDVEQTFASVTSDMLYLLSTSSPKSGNERDQETIMVNQRPIDFNELNPYEYTQDDYMGLIHPNTYAMVRGENLIKILDFIYLILDGHVHNIGEKALYEEGKEKELKNLINSMRFDLINQSLRIN